MSLSPEKVSELRQIIHNHVSQSGVQSRIRDVIAQKAQDNKDYDEENLDEADLMRILEQEGVVNDLLGQIRIVPPETYQDDFDDDKKATHFIDEDNKFLMKSGKKVHVDPTRRYLYLEIKGGKAFLEHLQENDETPGYGKSIFTIHIFFRGQRFRSRPTPCACDPDFKESFLLELHKDSLGDASRMADVATMIGMCDPVHLVLVKTDPTGDATLLSSHYLDWRTVLASKNSQMNTVIELLGIGPESKVPVGMLEASVQLIPKTVDLLPEEVVTTQVSLERGKQAERERMFLVYAKQWWKEYLEIRLAHSQRLVKIFAQDENGTNRPVCSYLKPMRAGRLLDTPRQAARFVSLLGYERVATVGGGKSEQWTSMHAFLCRSKGDAEDHALLLCSVLLGFGLDAYVCVGTKAKGAPHSWVLTIGTDGQATFWESLTGNRYTHFPINPDDPPAVPQPKVQYPYRTVGCVFNHQSFYANSQPSDAVELSVFDLSNESRWKAFSSDAISSVCSPGSTPLWPSLPPLSAPVLDAGLLSNDIEQQIRGLVSQHRRDQGLTTNWDDHLSYLLTPALAAYETERVTGVSAGNEEFQQAIRGAVPEGHTFKGYPIQFVHRNPRRAFNACLNSPVCSEIINCRGDQVRIGVRVRVFTYPESACATWLMFACKYKSVL